MGSSSQPDLRLPQGTPQWLMAFVADALVENDTLAQNGANQAVTARIALLVSLLAALRHYLNDEITVDEAAVLTGRHPETIRRALRSGDLPDRRANPKGHYRVRRGDLATFASPESQPYDARADAQDIAQQKRSR